MLGQVQGEVDDRGAHGVEPRARRSPARVHLRAQQAVVDLANGGVEAGQVGAVVEQPRGGGAFVQEQTRQLILDHAIAVWLDAEPAVLADRVRRRDTRPLLRGRDPEEILTELAAVRNPFYSLAPFRVKSVVAPHDATVNAILEAIGA